MTDAWINDRPIESYGLFIQKLTGWWDAPSTLFEATTLSPRAGQHLTDTSRTTRSREVTMKVLLEPSTLALRRGLLDSLYYACQGEVRLRISDDPSRFIRAYLQHGKGEPWGKALVNPETEITLAFSAADPYYYSVGPSELSIPVGGTTIRTEIPLGTAPSAGSLLLFGSNGGTPMVVTIRSKTGDPLQVITLTGTVASTEHVELDNQAKKIRKWLAGVATDIYSWMGTTDDFFILDPQDGPTIDWTSGTGAVFRYQKAYLS